MVPRKEWNYSPLHQSLQLHSCGRPFLTIKIYMCFNNTSAFPLLCVAHVILEAVFLQGRESLIMARGWQEMSERTAAALHSDYSQDITTLDERSRASPPPTTIQCVFLLPPWNPLSLLLRNSNYRKTELRGTLTDLVHVLAVLNKLLCRFLLINAPDLHLYWA